MVIQEVDAEPLSQERRTEGREREGLKFLQLALPADGRRFEEGWG
jgi:hypothetical protein